MSPPRLCALTMAALAFGIGTAASASEPKTPAPVPLVKLAPALVAHIRREFPAYHLPTQADMTDEWLAHGVEPFMTTGDFDGNGRGDTALILLGGVHWKLVAFHQDARGSYRSFLLATVRYPPADDAEGGRWTLGTMQKGEERNQESWDENSGNGEVTIVGKYKFPVDAVDLLHFDAGEILYHWNGTRYEEIDFGYE